MICYLMELLMSMTIIVTADKKFIMVSSGAKCYKKTDMENLESSHLLKPTLSGCACFPSQKKTISFSKIWVAILNFFWGVGDLS